MRLRFSKMHGVGNDYVCVDLFDQALPEPPETLAIRVSDRCTGVGADGLILIEPPDDRAAADVRMRIYNADGSRAQMCGNGVRCVGKYVWERGLARRNPLRLQTDAGVLTLELLIEHDCVRHVRVDMGQPRLDPAALPARFDGPRAIEAPLRLAASRPGEEATHLAITCVSMGNPHVVAFVNDVSRVPLSDWGPQIEWHAAFPERTNVHFAEAVSREHVRMVTWERGSGPTRACGTGACAVCVAGVLTDRCDRELRVSLPGGDLRIAWPAVSGGGDGPVYMTGPATHVFDGVLP